MTTAIIAGTGFSVETQAEHKIETPYGVVTVYELMIDKRKTYYLPRHGKPHALVPHKINYRANIWALASLEVTEIIAVAAVGGISKNISPRSIVVPDQIIDYTYGREHTFYDKDEIEYIEFSQPYDAALRQKLLTRLKVKDISHVDGGVYGVSQGPRLETAAEIKRMQRDGCDMVGMTAMPEAALAREKNIAYAGLAVSANWAAGIASDEIAMEEIFENLNIGMQLAQQILGVPH